METSGASCSQLDTVNSDPGIWLGLGRVRPSTAPLQTRPFPAARAALAFLVDHAVSEMYLCRQSQQASQSWERDKSSALCLLTHSGLFVFSPLRIILDAILAFDPPVSLGVGDFSSSSKLSPFSYRQEDCSKMTSQGYETIPRTHRRPGEAPEWGSGHYRLAMLANSYLQVLSGVPMVHLDPCLRTAPSVSLISHIAPVSV